MALIGSLRTRREDELAWQLKAAKVAPFVREARFHPLRKWRFDFSWPDLKLAVEVDGGLFIGGRHSSGAGAEKDMEKRNEALCMGWRVLRVSPRHVKTGQALAWIERALEICRARP